jgi:hypothetical protein
VSEESTPTLAVLDSSTLISRTAAFLHKSTANAAPVENLSVKEATALIGMSEHLLVFIGVLPDDWEFIAEKSERGSFGREEGQSG